MTYKTTITFYIMVGSDSAFHIDGENGEEIELIARNEDANEALSSSLHMSTITFKTYEEILLNIPKDDLQDNHYIST